MKISSTVCRISRVSTALVALTVASAALVGCSGAPNVDDEGATSSTALAMKSVGTETDPGGDDGPTTPTPTRPPHVPTFPARCLVRAPLTTVPSRLATTNVATAASTTTA